MDLIPGKLAQDHNTRQSDVLEAQPSSVWYPGEEFPLYEQFLQRTEGTRDPLDGAFPPKLSTMTAPPARVAVLVSWLDWPTSLRRDTYLLMKDVLFILA